jgi:hypothetical protein
MLIRGPPHKVSLFLDIRKVMFCLFKVWAFDVIWKKILGIFKWAGGPQVSHRSALLPWAPVATLTACFPRAPGVAGRWPALTIAALPHVRHPPYPRRQFTREAKFSFSPLATFPSSLHLAHLCLLSVPSAAADLSRTTTSSPPRCRPRVPSIAIDWCLLPRVKPSATLKPPWARRRCVVCFFLLRRRLLSSTTFGHPPVPSPPPQPPPECRAPHRLDLRRHWPLLQPSASVPHSPSCRCHGERCTVSPSPSRPQNGSTAPQRCSSPFHPPSLTAGEPDAAAHRRPAHMHSGLCQFPVIYFWIKWIGFKLQKFGRNSNNSLKLSNHFWYLNSNIFYRIKI